MTDRLTDERLDELERLLEAIPAHLETQDVTMEEYYGDWTEVRAKPEGTIVALFRHRDGAADAFMAARDALPALIAEVRALRRAGDDMAAALEALLKPIAEAGYLPSADGAFARAGRAALAGWRRVRGEAGQEGSS